MKIGIPSLPSRHQVTMPFNTRIDGGELEKIHLSGVDRVELNCELKFPPLGGLLFLTCCFFKRTLACGEQKITVRVCLDESVTGSVEQSFEFTARIEPNLTFAPGFKLLDIESGNLELEIDQFDLEKPLEMFILHNAGGFKELLVCAINQSLKNLAGRFVANLLPKGFGLNNVAAGADEPSSVFKACFAGNEALPDEKTALLRV